MLIDQFPLIDVITCCFRNRSVFDFAGLMVFIEKISIYLLIGATFYFSCTTKEDINAKHNSEPTACDTMFNEILVTCDEKFTAEIQRIFTMLNTSTARLDEIEQVLQNYHNNFGRVTTKFKSINGSISMLQNE